MKMDRTSAAILRQLKALGPASTIFDVAGLWPDGSIKTRQWQCETVIRSVAALRAWNTQGAAIYVRPAVPVGVILLDDVSRATVEAMTAAGFPPACVVETSPGNLQVWVKLIENKERKPLETRLVSRAVRLLAERFGADPGSADWRHFGRLGGLTNRKPDYQQESGLFPFVKVHEATGVVAPAGRRHLIAARRQLEKQDRQPVTGRSAGSAVMASELITEVPAEGSEPLGTYQQRRAAILTRNKDKPWSASPNGNIIDLWIAIEMVAAGWSDGAVCEVIMQRPGITEKHRVLDYLGRTLHKAKERLFPAPPAPASEKE
ncbi:MAG: hypothetical protein GY807_03435 [Gammaproteobacteria bacterium]|nr:hypothetical protein [Gammaproteobacteria bacterium]